MVVIRVFIASVLTVSLIVGFPLQAAETFLQSLNEGAAAYDEFNIEKAQYILENALSEHNLSVIATKDLIQAHLTLALCYVSQNKETQTFKSFLAILALDPSYVLAGEEFAPKLMKLFERASEAFFQHDYYVSLTSAPLFAEVFDNTKLLGVTPLTFKLSRKEEHLLEIKHKNYDVWHETFEKDFRENLVVRDVVLVKSEALQASLKGHAGGHAGGPSHSKAVRGDSELRSSSFRGRLATEESQVDKILKAEKKLYVRPHNDSLYKRWWFWTALGALAVGAVAYYELGRSAPPSPVYQDRTGTRVIVTLP